METEKPAKGKWSKVKDTDDLTFEIAKEKKSKLPISSHPAIA